MSMCASKRVKRNQRRPANAVAAAGVVYMLWEGAVNRRGCIASWLACTLSYLPGVPVAYPFYPIAEMFIVPWLLYSFLILCHVCPKPYKTYNHLLTVFLVTLSICFYCSVCFLFCSTKQACRYCHCFAIVN